MEEEEEGLFNLRRRRRKDDSKRRRRKEGLFRPNAVNEGGGRLGRFIKENCKHSDHSKL